MRVLLVNKFHWNKGGSEKYYFELGELLKQHGHEVAYFSMEDEKNVKTGDPEYFVPKFDLNNSSKLKALDVISNKENGKLMAKALDEFKPDIVIGCGGYVTAPVIYAANKLGIKTFIHEQNSVVGMSNKFLSRYATKIGVSFKETLNDFPKDKVVLTGNPCGDHATKVKGASKKEFGLSDKKKLVLIAMGSLGSRTVNDKIVSYLNDFDDAYEVLFVTGKAYYDKVKNLKTKANIKIVPYINELVRVLKITDVFVTRAGASSISEIEALKVPAIFIPSPYVPNNHQYKNASVLVQNGAGIMIEEKDLSKEKLLHEIDVLLNDKDKYNEIVKNLNKIKIDNSLDKIYEIIENLVK